MAYGNITGGSGIGSLLRQIQEQKSQSPIIPPSTEASSPVRGVIQEPLKGSEDIGTSKVLSLRPEGNVAGSMGATPEPLSAPGEVTTQGGIMGQIPKTEQPGTGIVPTATGDMNVMAARTAFGWGGMGGGPKPDVSQPKEAGKSAELKTPSIGTSITPMTPTVKGQVVNQPNRIMGAGGTDITDLTNMSTQARESTFNPGQIYSDLDKAIQVAKSEFDSFQQANPDWNKSYAKIQQFTDLANKWNAAEKAKSDFESAPAMETVQAYSSPTPSPSPSNPQGNNTGSSGGSSGGGSKPSSSSSSSKPGITYQSAPKQNISYSAPAQPNPINSANVKSGGLSNVSAPTKSAPAPSKPSVAQSIATVIKQSPFSWLFGKK